VTTQSLPLGERDVEARGAHVRACERISPAERPPGGALLGELLRYFDINIHLA
jgi:hypothetical protein